MSTATSSRSSWRSRLGAEALLFFSDTPGLLADKDDESTLIREIDATDPSDARWRRPRAGWSSRSSALKAIERGVGRVVFADARVEHPVRRALAGEGTRIGVPVASR